MLRIANPGSDIDSFIRIYQEVFAALKERASFDLYTMYRVLVERNLATSSGYMGEEALQRSYNEDASRNPLFNQAKMYSELYKSLGWLRPTSEGALIFQFTYLGAHVVAAKRDPSAIFKESLLGIAYPNAVLEVKSKSVLRLYKTILRTMAELDGLLYRDEMMVGPLCLEDDTDPALFDAMITGLKSLRQSWTSLQAKVSAISVERRIQINTMGNYTRFPIAVLKWTGWAKTQRRTDYYNRPTSFLALTAEGYKELQNIARCRDIRAVDIQAADERTKSAIIRIAFYQMLDRSGFDISSLREPLSTDLAQASTFLGDVSKPFLFSPFQELEPEYVSSLFPPVSGVKVVERSRLDVPNVQAILPQFSSPITLLATGEAKTYADGEIASLLANAVKQVGDNVTQIADFIALQQGRANKNEFYPFIARLFRALGYNCEHSRHGVNAQRWDAIIIDDEYSIPIEIKSPGEEEFLSVKAIRQALENKVILLSRRSYPTQPLTTSLVVGYKLPNDRSEVASLVADIHKAFGVVIGVIDLRSLLRLVAATVLQGKEHNRDEFRSLHGIIRVADA